ncbi:hypothetical protein [uncultured Tateyamaria sp.]|uniref:hypothetical protein n=1 Tax=uncultured Tateyamaria sp. TaxID=455651 RepID=UPI0026393B33|nr:hypothetical protein [uncultured Tateyamaria sp.]
MARLKLKDGVTYQQVGQAIAALATEAKDNRETTLSTNTIDGFTCLIDQSKEVLLDEPLVSFGPETFPSLETDSVQLAFHVDRTIEQAGQRVRVVNIVVPDFDDKVSRLLRDGGKELKSLDREAVKSLIDLDEVAKEAFGFITICGCAG